MYKINREDILRLGYREAGAALFVSLVFLFTLTIIGLAGMQNTALQEKMAGNLRDRNLAFQAADSALRVGEAMLANTATRPSVFACSSDSDGLYSNTAPGTASNCPTESGWPSSDPASHPYPADNDNFWKNNTDVIVVNNAQFSNLAEKPKYVVEQMNVKVDSLEAGKALQTEVSYYRVTARGVGTTGNAVVVLQAVYYPPN